MTVAHKGHVKVARRAFDPEHGDPFWLEPREFSRWEAWVDVIQLAAFRARAHVTLLGTVALRRGEFVASLRWLADRWKWTVKKVRGWLALLEKLERIRAQREEHAGMVYLVVNYELDQSPEETQDGERAQGAQLKAHQRAQSRPAQAIDAAAVSLTENPQRAQLGAQQKAQERSSTALDGKSNKQVESISGAVAPKLEIVAHSWPAEGAGWWVETVGRMTAGRFGKVLKPFVDAHGWPAVRIALVRWVIEQQSVNGGVKLEWFADKCAMLVNQPAQPIVDDHGVLTPYGDKLTRTARLA